MTHQVNVIPSIARNLLLNQTKADSSGYAPKEVPLGDALGMTAILNWPRNNYAIG
jgi:hypothetical protein